MYRLVSVFLVVGAVAVSGEEEGIHGLISKAFNKCKAQYPISDAELEMVREKENVPDSANAKCIMACLLKEGKIMKDGKYYAENALLMIDILHKNEPETAAKAKKVVEHCADQVGSDAGSEECEFAYKMAVCASAEAKKVGVHPPEF